MRPVRTVVLVAAAVACLASGCDRPTETPGGVGGDPGSKLDGNEDRLVGAGDASGEGDGKQALPTVRDRDPEEEKKKMALSRKHSAEARRALQRGALDPAIEQARQALRTHEQNVDAMLVIAEAFYRQGKYGLAQAVTSSALAVDPKIRSPQETSRAHNLMGFALIALGNETQATAAFKKAAEADEKNAAAWNNLGTRYLDAGDADTALGCFTYALELQPGLAKAHVNHGAALRAKKQWAEAEKALMHALRLRKNYAEAYFNLGVLYLDADPFPGLDTTKRLNKAIANLTKYRELAIADGPRGPGGGSASAGSSGSGRGPASLGPAVSRDRADDYIRVAKKGLEREQRRAEREKERQAKGATGASEATKPSGTKPAEQPPSDDSGSASPQKPDPSAPSKPEKPSQPAPEKPSQPAPEKPSQPAPEKPSQPAPEKPSGSAPPADPPSVQPQKPKVQKPS